MNEINEMLIDRIVCCRWESEPSVFSPVSCFT